MKLKFKEMSLQLISYELSRINSQMIRKSLQSKKQKKKKARKLKIKSEKFQKKNHKFHLSHFKKTLKLTYQLKPKKFSHNLRKNLFLCPRRLQITLINLKNL